MMEIKPEGVSSNTPNASVINGVIQKLYSLSDLPEGWNSYRARAVQPELIARAVRWVPTLFQATTPEPAVVPRVRGGLQLEWHRKGVDLEIYIESPADIHFVAEDSASRERVEAPLDGNEQLLSSWIARVAS